MTKHRTTNVWSCADDNDVPSLKRALRLVPSAATLAAWSYCGGRRRGVFYDVAKACFVVSDDPRARPATLLHIAAVRNSVEIAVVALSGGANAEQPLGVDPNTSVQMRRPTSSSDDTTAEASREEDQLNLATPLYIAQVNNKAGLTSNEFVNLLELAVLRTQSGLQKLMEEESLQRTLIETRHGRRVKLFEEFVMQGVAELTVEIRGLMTRVPAPLSTTVTDVPTNVSTDVPSRPASSATTGGKEGSAALTVDTTVVTSKQFHKIFVRRCASKAELQSAVDALAGQSTSISFLIPKEGSSRPASRVASPASTTDSPTRTRNTETEVFVELNSKNIPFLLCKPHVTCVARPLLRIVSEQPEVYEAAQQSISGKSGKLPPTGSRSTTPSGASSVDVSRILDDLRQQNRSANSPQRKNRGALPPRVATPIEELRRAVEAFDSSRAASPANHARLNTSATTAMNLSKKTISSEDADAMMDRLYSRDVKTIAQKRAEADSYVEEGAARLTRRPKLGELSSDMEEAVARLCYEAVQRKADKVAEIEARVMEMVPRAKESSLSTEDADAARERLTSTDHKKEVFEELKSKYHNDLKKYKPLSKERFDASVRKNFVEAVEKRASNLAKLEAEYGDFRAKKRPAMKISREQEKEIGDRLCKKS